MVREMLKSIPSSPLHAPLFIKLIDFNEKVVSDVTSETTFSLKSIYLMKREDERGMRGACVAPLLWSLRIILPPSNDKTRDAETTSLFLFTSLGK
jgi:hypothetical protein